MYSVQRPYTSQRWSPPLYMNNVVLKWTKGAKHLCSIVTYDLKENEEINHKRNDFIGRVSSVISNFKHVDNSVFRGFYVTMLLFVWISIQAWLLDSRCIKTFSTTWRKAIRKLWCLPNTTRSNIVPYLVGAPPLEEQLFRRVAKMYNAIRQGFNSKLLLLLDIRVCSSKMGIMGVNTKLISCKCTVVTNISNATVRFVILRQASRLLQSRSSRKVIFLASPTVKFQISSPILPAFELKRLRTLSPMIICV